MSSCCCLKTCGDAELNSCFTLTVFTFLWLLLSLCFSLGLLGSDRLLESSERSCGEQGFELPCLSQLPVGASFLAPSAQQEAVHLNRVLCSNNHHLNGVYLCIGSCWLSWWGPHVLDQAGNLLLFLFWDCRHQLQTFFDSS